MRCASGLSGRRDIQPALRPMRLAVMARLLSAPATFTSSRVARCRAWPTGVESRSILSPNAIRSGMSGSLLRQAHHDNRGRAEQHRANADDRGSLPLALLGIFLIQLNPTEIHNQRIARLKFLK